MTPQELKNSILQLAIQGKLVEQHKSEESVALNSSFSGDIADLYDIPEKWKWLSINDIATVSTGLSFKKQEQRDSVSGSLRVLRGGNIGDDFKYHLFDNDVYVDKDSFEQKYIPLIANDIITPSVTSMEKICKTGFIDNDLSNVTAGGFVYIIRTKDPTIIEPKYLLYFISSSFNKEQCKPNIHKSGQAFYNLKKSGFIEQPICVPPLAEQKRIVAKIEELLPLINRYEEAWTKLEEFNKRFPGDMQKSLLQMAIQGKLVEQRPEEGTGEELYTQIQAEKQALIKSGKIKKDKPLPEITDDEKPFDIPESWKWVRLGECSTYSSAKEKISPSDITGDMWSLDLEDIEKETGKIVNYCFAKNRKITGDKVVFHSGQILYSKLRPYLKKILVAPKNGICTPELVPFSMIGAFENAYILYVLKAPHIDYVINSVTYGVKMPRVGTDTMVNLLIPVPPLAEQKRIVAKIEELLPLCERLK